MNDKKKTKEQILRESTKLRQRISELEKAEAELKCNVEVLRENEEKYRSLLENSLDFIINVDHIGKILFINHTLPEFTVGKTIGKSLYEFVPSKYHDAYKKTIDQVFETGQPTLLEAAGYGPNGRTSKYISRFAPIKRNDKVRSVMIIATDITERRLMEKALLDSEDRYRNLFEKSPASITLVDNSGVIIDCNKATEKLTGYSKNEIIGKSYEKLLVLSEKDMAKLKEYYKRLLKGDVVDPYELEIIRENGKKRWINVINSLLVQNGEVVGFQIIATDITKHKWADDALKQSEERYKTLTENINVGIYRNTPGQKGKFIEANRSIVKIFGYKNKEEFLKIDVAHLYQNPKDRKRFNEKILKDGFVKDEELQLKKKSGVSFIGSVSAVAVKDENGAVKYYDGIIEDITERKRDDQKIHNNFVMLETILEETVDALASVLGKRDPYTGGHQKRVTTLACAIAEEMGLSEQKLKGLRLAGLLHDIGKIAIPAEILSKPSELTRAEFNIVKEHPQIGYDILKAIEFPWPIADIVLQHHELLDGSGYPKGLNNGKILVEARILCVADIVEAMCSHRPYRPAHSLKTTLDEITKYRGILYDAQVVDICLRLFKEKKFKFNEGH